MCDYRVFYEIRTDALWQVKRDSQHIGNVFSEKLHTPAYFLTNPFERPLLTILIYLLDQSETPPR